MTNIYKIFHNEEPFSHLLTNWEEREHTSTLIDELYSFHYQLKKFNITINDDVPNNCRLQDKRKKPETRINPGFSQKLFTAEDGT